MDTKPLCLMQGESLIEALVTIVILAVGLLGLAGLQMRLQSSEIEAYQRTQALLLLDDMANRMGGNRKNAVSYVSGSASPLGSGDAQPAICAGSGQGFDTCQWSNALKGAAEQSGANNVGAMIGARGCIENLGADQYQITVVWQGLTPISAPVSACGAGLYNGTAGSGCINELCRRAMSTIVRVANLGTP